MSQTCIEIKCKQVQNIEAENMLLGCKDASAVFLHMYVGLRFHIH